MFGLMNKRPASRTLYSFSQVSELERRAMLAGDIGAAMSTIVDSCEVNSAEETTPNLVGPILPGAQDIQHSGSPEILVFIDANIDGSDQMLDSVPANANVILLNTSEDPLLQITAAIVRARNVGSVHIISHGRSGEIELAGTVLDERAINQAQQLLGLWKQSLLPGADLMLYGCDVASGTKGRDFINQFAALSGMDIAASLDKTGDSRKGGDWELEQQIGNIESSLVFKTAFQSEYASVLPMTFLSSASRGSSDADGHSGNYGDFLRHDRFGQTYHGQPSDNGKFTNVLNFSNFADTSRLRLNGTAASNGNGLELTQVYGGLGSAFATKPLTIADATSLRTQFQFRIDGGQGTNGADGFVFMIQNNQAGLATLANTGGSGHGYAGTAKSIAIEFDTYQNKGDINDNHISVFANGDMEHPLATRAVPFDLNSGKTLNAWVEYDGKSNQLSVYVSQSANKPHSPLLKTQVDLPEIVGTKAYVGFSAATGSYVNRHEILNWQLDTKQPPGIDDVDVILEWNEVLLNANAVDHARASPEEGGPILTSRAFAIVSGAMYDAYNSIEHIGSEFSFTASQRRDANVDAAVAQAAHDTLVALYPSQKAVFKAELTGTLSRIANGSAENEGRRIGAQVAAKTLQLRAADDVTSVNDPNYAPKSLIGFHNVDPLHPNQGFYGTGTADFEPFVINNLSDFTAPRLDDGTAAGRLAFLNSAQYTQAYNEVLALGGDGITTPTQRTSEQTEIGVYWGYDGRPGIGTPPRLYNQIVRTVAAQEGNTEAENARLFALVNIAMADAGIATWETKYADEFWRPVLGIRSGELDGNSATIGNTNWSPLGGPASNPNPGDSNFTPNFPAYSSGHATFGAATFETLKNFYGTDAIAFSFVSDELNGVTRDANGSVRPLAERTFSSFTQAKLENAQSRIYLGIHWSFDASEGIVSGDNVADYVFANALRPYV